MARTAKVIAILSVLILLLAACAQQATPAPTQAPTAEPTKAPAAEPTQAPAAQPPTDPIGAVVRVKVGAEGAVRAAGPRAQPPYPRIIEQIHGIKPWRRQ